MEERAKVPVSLPRPLPTTSYWQDPPSDVADLRTTRELLPTADHVIIGSGVSGSCIAHNLLKEQPGASVVMLEARQACSGATGRNGGHTKAASYRSFLDHERELGTQEAVKIARMEYENVKATHALARAYDIDCASTECDTVDIIYSQTHLELGRKAIERMRLVMGADDPAARYTVHEREEARSRFLTPTALGAFSYYAGSLSAYQFAIGVLKLALQRGLHLQTNTPANGISHSTVNGQAIWTVQTLRGSITTPNLVLATNGYTAHILPELQGLIVPLHGQVVAQRPGSGLPQTGMEHTYSFIYKSGYEYMITRPPGSASAGTRSPGDIVIGGGLHQLANNGASRYGNTDDSTLDPTITSYLRNCTVDSFGQNWGDDRPDGRIKKEWSGIMGATADGLPYVGAVPNNRGLYICAGFNGHGMVWCLKSAEALVGMMAGTVAERNLVHHWFPRSAVISNERMKMKFTGRKDLKAPGEAEFGERSKL